MGFINDLTGATNDFHATAPVNTFNASPDSFQLNNFAAAIQQAQQAAGGGGATGPVSGMQSQLAQALMARANGTGGPSPAELQLQQTLQQNQASAAGSAASMAGVSPALAARLAAQNQAGLAGQAAGQGALLRANEQQGAQSLLAQALAAQRQGDLGQQGQSTALLQALTGANQGQNALRLGTQQINAGVAAGNQQADLAAQQINSGVAAANASQNASTTGGILGGGARAFGLPFDTGGPVPGAAPAPGNSPRNDTVPAMLSPGEIVLPRTVAQAEDAPEKAAAFVRAIQRKHYAKGGEAPDYGRVLSKQRELDQRLKHLEKLCSGGRVAA